VAQVNLCSDMFLKTPVRKGEVEFNGGKVWCPRLVFVAIASTYLFLIGIWVERLYRLNSQESVERLQLRDQIIPNYHHINNDRDIFYYQKGRGALNKFGLDFLAVGGDWKTLCHMDSDYDGFSNGQELGDPCCRWKATPPHESYSLKKNREFRRWFVSNPGDNQSSWLAPGQFFPEPNCSAPDYEAADYENSFRAFYYRSVRDAVHCDPPKPGQLVGVVSTCLLFLDWMINRGLLLDLVPFIGPGRMRRASKLIMVGVAAFWFMDLTSGMSHLCLDYMPNWIPIAGPVANGFQVHHRDPSLLARKRIWNQVNDVFIIMPLPVIFLVGLNPSRITRLFYFLCICFAILFLMAHPWAHMPRDMVPRPVAIAQAWGVLLGQDAHQRHHADLESQFTILSGHADIVIDRLSQLVTPQRYDIWLFFVVTWMIAPVALDVRFRGYLNRMASVAAENTEDKHTMTVAV